ncbi:hypothetical protein P280DRAFT_483466 [Massarina eburnea CBS 473.64]|uniref:Uncharacterized protein n=1 Tax=Massarina eburnea CBS 473.64 TaxID=1395130 RepID=A0A6A6RNK0_9PLEO|nr:hypothetical protein P280DRAFT_483466 [Massarina eburnea CBS 473.64]
MSEICGMVLSSEFGGRRRWGSCQATSLPHPLQRDEGFARDTTKGSRRCRENGEAYERLCELVLEGRGMLVSLGSRRCRDNGEAYERLCELVLEGRGMLISLHAHLLGGFSGPPQLSFLRRPLPSLICYTKMPDSFSHPLHHDNGFAEDTAQASTRQVGDGEPYERLYRRVLVHRSMAMPLVGFGGRSKCLLRRAQRASHTSFLITDRHTTPSPDQLLPQLHCRERMAAAARSTAILNNHAAGSDHTIVTLASIDEGIHREGVGYYPCGIAALSKNRVAKCESTETCDGISLDRKAGGL